MLEEIERPGTLSYALYGAPHRMLQGVFPCKKKEYIGNYLLGMPGRERVRAVVIPADSELRRIIKHALPDAEIALEKQCFLNLIDVCMSRTLNHYKDNLDPQEEKYFGQMERLLLNKKGLSLPAVELSNLWFCLRKYPHIKTAYFLWETAKRFFSQPQSDPVEALKLFLWSVPSYLPGCKPIHTIGFAWHIEILNYLRYFP